MSSMIFLYITSYPSVLETKECSDFIASNFMVFDYTSDPEHQIIPVNIVPKGNLPNLKQCEIKIVKPEDKEFFPPNRPAKPHCGEMGLEVEATSETRIEWRFNVVETPLSPNGHWILKEP